MYTVKGIIFVLLFFVFSAYAEKEKKCLNMGSYDIVFYKIGEEKGFYVLKMSSKKKMRLGVYCNKVNQVVLCYGDDDAGTFELSSSGIIIKSPLTFSENPLKFVEVGQKGQKVDFIKCPE